MRIHFMGIGGSGASAVAAIAKSQGFEVSGCDKFPFNEFTNVFNKSLLFEGHSPKHLKNIDLLAISPAIISLDKDNLEIAEAKKKNIPVLTWQEFMGEYLEKEKFVIAISGTHGKSTTTAMVGQLLEDAGLDPTVELGAIIPKWGTNYRIGKSNLFVTEADEFNDNFLASTPDIAIVTTIEMDHPEYFKDFNAYKESFKKFLSKTKGKIIANFTDSGVKQTLDSHLDNGKIVIDYSKNPVNFPLQIPGEYSILNASAVYQVGLALGIKPEIIKKSLANFSGIGRRFELIGEKDGAKIYSDFAHHPTEISVTLKAAREKFPNKKITAIFQPHMFSRTHALFNEFVETFKELPVDKIYITDIFPSREVDTGLVNTKQLVEATNGKSVYISKEKILSNLKKQINNDDIIFFIGAGDIDKIARELVKR